LEFVSDRPVIFCLELIDLSNGTTIDPLGSPFPAKMGSGPNLHNLHRFISKTDEGGQFTVGGRRSCGEDRAAAAAD